MKTNEINIRDPYILKYENQYYLYGTRAKSTWGPMDGFDCYVGKDLENWNGPYEIFKKTDDFWANQNYWAPECYYHQGHFYLVTTLGASDRKKAVHLLKSTQPTGPFTYVTQLTPFGQECIDGTIYQKDNRSYLVYSHTFEDSPKGDMCALELADNWESPLGEPFKLFSADEANWANPIPFAKSEFGLDGDIYFSDGPSLFEKDGQLLMLWSSWGTKGYSVGLAQSTSGEMTGPWVQTEEALIENGGHGMLFNDLAGKQQYTYHYPNDFEKERPHFVALDQIL